MRLAPTRYISKQYHRLNFTSLSSSGQCRSVYTFFWLELSIFKVTKCREHAEMFADIANCQIKKLIQIALYMLEVVILDVKGNQTRDTVMLEGVWNLVECEVSVVRIRVFARVRTFFVIRDLFE